MQSVTILGVRIDSVSVQQTLDRIVQFMAEPGVHQICTANPEFVMKAQGDAAFMNVLDSAELNLADGIGLVLASRWLGKPVPERVPGSTLVYQLAELCAAQGWSLYLLGAAPGVAADAAAILQARYPGLEIAGTYSGSPAMAENDAIVARINTSAADVLGVAYGAPNQDKWIARNRHALETVRVAMGIGGSLDFIAGVSVRAPDWVQRLGFEWLHRLIKEPWRWRRMLALPRFVIAVLLQVVRSRRLD